METKIIDGTEYVAETIKDKGLCFVPKKVDLWDEFIKEWENPNVLAGDSVCKKYNITFPFDISGEGYRIRIASKSDSSWKEGLPLFATWDNISNIVDRGGRFPKMHNIREVVTYLRTNGYDIKKIK